MEIYQILNTINNKSYIGKSKNHHNRYKSHLKEVEKRTNRCLYDAINRYGQKNFSLILLEDLGECSNEYANERERYWITTLRTKMPLGYNMTDGGDGGNTLSRYSDEEKKAIWNKQAARRLGQKRTDETKKLLSSRAKGRVISQEQRNQISETLKRKYNTKELIAKTPKLFGKDHPLYVNIDIDDVLFKIQFCWTLKRIAEAYQTTTVTIGTRLKKQTGKTFIEWRKDYGIVGRLSNPRVE